MSYINISDLNIKNKVEAIASMSEEQLLEYKKETEKDWRNKELSSTDWIVPITDHPKNAAYLVYRQELRDYPQQEDFPSGVRPVKP